MSLEDNCAMEEDSDNEANDLTHSTQTKRMSNCSNIARDDNQHKAVEHPQHTNKLQPIQYVDSMDCDSTSNKPRTLFSLLLDKRKRRKGRNQKSCTNASSSSSSSSSCSTTSSYKDIQDKLTQEELRVIKDLKEISDSKWCARGTIVTIHLFQRLHNFKCTISPIEGPYRDGTFSFDVSVCKKYPFTPPQIKACHPMFHPNVNLHTLQVGLPLLRKCEWKPVLSLNDVLFSLQLMFMQPNIDAIEHSQVLTDHHNKTTRMQHETEQEDLDKDDDDLQMTHVEKRGDLRSNVACNRNRSRSQFAFGSNNHKPAYIPNINYSHSRSNSASPSHSNSDSNAYDEKDAIIQNMEAAVLFRDEPQQFESVCQQIIRGGVSMFGTNWQCIERKKMRNLLNRNMNGEKYDPSLFGSQSFKVKAQIDTMDASTGTITKKCSVLRKRRRNESFENEHDVFSMQKVKRALATFASTTGSIRDCVHSDSGESQSSLINGVNGIQIQLPPEKKRRVDPNGITERDVGRISIVQTRGAVYNDSIGVLHNVMANSRFNEHGFGGRNNDSCAQTVKPKNNGFVRNGHDFDQMRSD